MRPTEVARAALRRFSRDEDAVVSARPLEVGITNTEDLFDAGDDAAAILCTGESIEAALRDFAEGVDCGFHHDRRPSVNELMCDAARLRRLCRGGSRAVDLGRVGTESGGKRSRARPLTPFPEEPRADAARRRRRAAPRVNGSL